MSLSKLGEAQKVPSKLTHLSPYRQWSENRVLLTQTPDRDREVCEIGSIEGMADEGLSCRG